MRALGRTTALLLLAIAASPACAFRSRPVTRIVDGIEAEGRPVSDDAYAAYARATVLEAQGDDRAALVAYRQALEADADSAEILARIAAVQCRISPVDVSNGSDAASKSFAKALKSDETSSVAWLELARCETRRARYTEALVAARRAVEYDPNATTGALMVANLCERTGNASCARTWLDGVTTLRPESREAWMALLAFAERHADRGRRLRAQAGLAALASTKKSEERVIDAQRSPSVLAEQRTLAMERGVTPAGLALELLSRGETALAREQAELVLGADPDNTDAWITLLAAADLDRDLARLAEVARRPPTAPSAPSALAVQVHAALLDRLIGAQARAAWLAANRARP